VDDQPVDDRDRVPALKASLRRLMRDVRRAVPADDRDRQGRAVADRLMALLDDIPTGAVVLSYASISGELPTEVINARLAERWRVALPRVTPAGVEAVVGATRSEPKSFGIAEPVDGDVVPPSDLAAVIVPGLAFTAGGHRLGHGGGYYDRFLPMTNGRSIGVCLTEQMVEGVPVADHDVTVLAVIAAPATPT
jgi:5-formyltetrahydrofolate cyclo-ligase